MAMILAAASTTAGIDIRWQVAEPTTPVWTRPWRINSFPIFGNRSASPDAMSKFTQRRCPSTMRGDPSAILGRDGHAMCSAR